MSKPRDRVTPEYLSKIWNCGLRTAQQTIEASTCRYYRQVDEKGMTRRFRTSRDLFRYKQLSVPVGEFYSDTLFVNVRSARGFTCAQVYGNKFGFLKVYPMESNTKEYLGDTLTCLVQDVGVPQKLHSDNANEMIGRSTPFFKRSRKEGIDLTTIEPKRPNESYAENLVRQIKTLTSLLMHRRNVPLRLWCYAMEYASDLHSISVPGMYRNRGRTGYELVFGITPDISEYVEFQFYDFCWYWDTPQSFPHEKKHLGRWLGIARRVGQAMVYFVMNTNGKVIARSTVTSLEPSEYSLPETTNRMNDLDKTIKDTLGDYRNASKDSRKDIPELDEDDLVSQLSYCFDVEPSLIDTSDEKTYSDPARPDYDDAPNMEVESEAFDRFLGASLEVPSQDGEGKVLAKVKERKRNSDGELIGSTHENPILSTAIYKVESPDGTINEYSANIIAENLYSQVDDDGYNFDLLYEIVGYRKDQTAVESKDGYFTTKSGTKRKVITTKGWQLHVQWENGERSWIALKDIKESNPIEVAKFAVDHGIDSEPAFAWWVKQALKKRNAFIGKASMRHNRNMKFGIKIPRTFEEAVALDRENGNSFWQDAVKKEMKNVEIAFKFLEDGTEVPIGFKEISCHIIFDVKFSLERKARYVAGGHLNKVPPAMTYASVVSRDSVRIMFLLAALNDLDIKMCDIGNAYLNAETRERVWFQAGHEWGSRCGCKVIITRALYGLKSSGAEWKKVLADYIKHTLGFDPSFGADDNVYLRAEKDDQGKEYYSYIVCFVDDILCLHKKPDKYLDLIGRDFRLKTTPEPPKMYLGGDISKFNIPDSENNISCWAMSGDSHIRKALEVVESVMAKDGVRFRASNKCATHPFSTQSYRPELDTTEYCDEHQTKLFQSFVGILRWLCELGRVDILTETSVLSHHLVSPRVGHLHQVLHIFKYLKDHKRSKLVFDPSYINISDNDLPIEERAATKAKFMAELYKDAVEDIPRNAPKPRGRPVQISCFVDADHAGDSVTRRSRTGVLIFLNSAPIIWYSKRQNTVETSTFGSEFVAMRQAFEMIKALKYKLRMFGVEILDGETKLFGDNNSVVTNSSCPESTLSKKHHSINYHYVRECVAAGVGLVYKVDTDENLADLFTKILDGIKRKKILMRITY